MGCGQLKPSTASADVGAPREDNFDSADPAHLKEREAERAKRASNLKHVLEQVTGSQDPTLFMSVTSSNGHGTTSLGFSGHGTDSMASMLQFAKPDQTIIIFDWDDTLCPSTSLRRQGCVQFTTAEGLQRD